MTYGEQVARVSFAAAGFKADTGPLATVTLTKHALAAIIDSGIELYKLDFPPAAPPKAGGA